MSIQIVSVCLPRVRSPYDVFEICFLQFSLASDSLMSGAVPTRAVLLMVVLLTRAVLAV